MLQCPSNNSDEEMAKKKEPAKPLKKAKRYRKAHKKGLAWAPIRKLMGSVGAQIVARDAVETLKRHLEETAVDLTTKAMKFTKLANRKKIQASDIDLAIKM